MASVATVYPKGRSRFECSLGRSWQVEENLFPNLFETSYVRLLSRWTVSFIASLQESAGHC